MGVIAKRPIANAAWKTGQPPLNAYHTVYWERLQKLDYDFLKQPLPLAIAKALRFTLSQSGVHTAIVGTTKPGRWKENADMIAPGQLSPEENQAIRSHWNTIAEESWKGQI